MSSGCFHRHRDRHQPSGGVSLAQGPRGRRSHKARVYGRAYAADGPRSLARNPIAEIGSKPPTAFARPLTRLKGSLHCRGRVAASDKGERVPSRLSVEVRSGVRRTNGPYRDLQRAIQNGRAARPLAPHGAGPNPGRHAAAHPRISLPHACRAPAGLQNRLTRFFGQAVGLCGAPERLVMPSGASVVAASVAVLLDQPSGVVAGGEGANGVSDVVDGLEDPCRTRSAP